MSLDMENEQESLVEESKDTETDNEEINNCEQLEEKKHEFNVEGNSAQNQIFIQDAGPGGFTINYYAEKIKPDVPKLSVEEKYDLRIQRECIEFTEKFVNSEYFTIAFLLCVFKAVPLTDLAQLRLTVENCLMKGKIRSDAEQEERTQKDNACVSLNSIFAVIGANKFIVADDKLCVGIGENSTRALINMLEQFPMLHELYEKFMSEITQDSKYHDSFYEIQLASSIAEVWTAKVMDIQNCLYPQLCENMNNTYLLGYFVYKLYFKNAEATGEILRKCLLQEKTWLWRVVSVTYILFRENDIYFPLEDGLKVLLTKKIFFYRRNDFSFMADLLIQSKYFRDMICCAFSSAYMRANTSAKQSVLAQSYLNLVRLSYYRVDCVFVELPLVACDTKKQQEYLSDILERVMSEYRLRKQLYVILKTYLKELSRYESSEKVIRYVAAFCSNLFSSDEEYREDIKDLLQDSGSRAAKQVLDTIKANE